MTPKTGTESETHFQLERLMPLDLSIEVFGPSSSRAALSEVVCELMAVKNISLLDLHTKTGLDMSLLRSIMLGTFDFQDSEPVSKLEIALGASLNHL